MGSDVLMCLLTIGGRGYPCYMQGFGCRVTNVVKVQERLQHRTRLSICYIKHMATCGL